MHKTCFSIALLLAGLAVVPAHAQEMFPSGPRPPKPVVMPTPPDGSPGNDGQASEPYHPSIFESCCSALGGGSFYGSAEYLVWWQRGDALPPLVTFGSFNDAPFAGALGEPGTVLVFGGDRVSTDAHSGGRFTVGYALDKEGALAVEATYFLLEQGNQLFNAVDGGNIPGGVIALPFFNTQLNREDSLTLSGPTIPGGVAISLHDQFQGAELNFRAATGSGGLRVGVLGGFRYLSLNEALNIGSIVDFPGNISTLRADSFETRNSFYGGQLGVTAEFRGDRWFLDGSARFALGGDHQTVTILGQTTTTTPTSTTSFAGAVFAQPSNSGVHGRGEFAFVPEFRLNVGYRITDRATAFVGYTFLYDTAVVRPGEEIDRAFPGPFVGVPTSATRPAFSFNETTFWAQGISFGLQVQF